MCEWMSSQSCTTDTFKGEGGWMGCNRDFFCSLWLHDAPSRPLDGGFISLWDRLGCCDELRLDKRAVFRLRNSVRKGVDTECDRDKPLEISSRFLILEGQKWKMMGQGER
ncbi:hypothetical protein CEXT_690551 [Caerostris extrusa]|uniref:Uncharacterized protein n=1 Tax=Caerostris extrusa TaxID=172846 RepID=A0AAV4MNR8_CAEEX|nr:hypothetical protein CEXT_690551 [Caerostris extrusa]